jgi:hypothetical protein
VPKLKPAVSEKQVDDEDDQQNAANANSAALTVASITIPAAAEQE